MNLSKANMPLAPHTLQLQEETRVTPPLGMDCDLIVAIYAIGKREMRNSTIIPSPEGCFHIPKPEVLAPRVYQVFIYAYKKGQEPFQPLYQKQFSFVEFFQVGSSYTME